MDTLQNRITADVQSWPSALVSPCSAPVVGVQDHAQVASNPTVLLICETEIEQNKGV
jgi:hypothetical protein